MAPSVMQLLERGRQSLEVGLERRRQLPEQRSHLRRAEQWLDALVEQRQVHLHVLKPLDVRDVPADLDREREAGRRLFDPARDDLRFRQAVERHVDLDGVEELRVVAEPVARRAARWVEDAVSPVVVVPAGAADPAFPAPPASVRRYPVSAVASRVHSSSFPAATTRERPSRSRGAAANGGASGSSIARPCSTTSSCAAAMSTERAAFSDTYAVVVASNDRISSWSFGRSVIGLPSRSAPPPRVAVHSSRAPKS